MPEMSRKTFLDDPICIVLGVLGFLLCPSHRLDNGANCRLHRQLSRLESTRLWTAHRTAKEGKKTPTGSLSI